MPKYDGMQWKSSEGWILQVIHEKNDGLLDENDNVIVILKCLPRRMTKFMHSLFSHREFLLDSSNPRS